MAKLHFYYSTMNAGKSTLLLQANHNYQTSGHDTLLFIPKETEIISNKKIVSNQVEKKKVKSSYDSSNEIAKSLQSSINKKFKIKYLD